MSAWTRAEVERLRYMAEFGLTCPAAAAKLPGRTELAVRDKATKEHISFRGRRGKSEDEKLRERWSVLLPRLKEALRRDIEINI